MTEVIIQEELIKTGGNFAYQGYSFLCQPGVETIFDSTFPIPVTGMCMKIQAAHPNIGDSLSFSVNPNTPVGVTATGSLSGDNKIYFTPPAALMVGYYIKVGTENCGRVTAIAADHITISHPLTTNVAVGTVITATKTLVNNHVFNIVGEHTIGASKIGGAYLPAGTMGRVTYKNNGATPTLLVFGMEYLY